MLQAMDNSSFDLSALSSSLRTVDVSLISHTHGRERRAERNVQRLELQAAVKHGLKERGNPGRDGSLRWRYTHNGVVYITDETSRHEITSWRIDGEHVEGVAVAEVELAGKGSHAVLIVDHSGSMKKDDVAGYSSRFEALYQCLIRDFAQSQVKSGAAEDTVVTLISMSDTATIQIHTQPLDESLMLKLEKISNRAPRSHGNYIPALDKALEVMTADAPNRARLLLLFCSDGAPSDSTTLECEHGVKIFEVDRKEDALMGHRSAGSAWQCRKNLHERIKRECLERIRKIGDVFGRDKVILRTLAFGPAKEDFRLLEDMAAALPRGEFSKLGLNATNLKTAFSSLSSSMTELRTEGGSRTLTRRDKVVNKDQKIDLSSDVVRGRDGWWIYSFEGLVGKFEFKSRVINPSTGSSSRGEMVPCPLTTNATGLAFFEQPFAEGAERFVYRCTEIEVPKDKAFEWYYQALQLFEKNLMLAERRGLRLVAKEAKDVENLHLGRAFHETFARVQHDAAMAALQFNQRMPMRRPEFNISFLPTSLYHCLDVNYKDNAAWVLVEQELDGKFTKWNNNAGAIRTSMPGLDALLEEDEDEDEDEPIDVNDVPQAFSHFSYEASRGKQLVCDLQGVWNPADGFMLTDPVVHYMSSSGRKHKNGATDKGFEGMKRFFQTHKCGPLCAKMLLPVRTVDDLIIMSPQKRMPNTQHM
jgi:hypothetical protein